MVNFKYLKSGINVKAGRNAQGKITVSHKGGGHKRKYRIIDFNRYSFWNISGLVVNIEYDPNRSADIALICYKNGIFSYILAVSKMVKEDLVFSGDNVPNKIGFTTKIGKMPVGSIIHNVGLTKLSGGVFARAAGTFVQIIAHHFRLSIIRLKSGEVRKIDANCLATFGSISNSDHSLRVLGKAGVSRWLGHKPVVRGMAKNPVDHPHGGRTKGGISPRSPWGWLTKGVKTRNKRNPTNIFILTRRVQKL